MHDASISEDAERYGAIDRDILYLLTNGQQIWSVDDLGRDIENTLGAEDAVRDLKRAGLVHQTSDGFVFVTRAARCAVEMIGKVV